MSNILTTTFFLVICTTAFGQTIANGSFNNGGDNWGCNPEVNPETTYGGSNSNNYVAEVDQQNALCQTISGFSVGARYRLRLRVSRRTTCGPTFQGMKIIINNGALNVDVSRNGTAFNLTQEAFEFVATSTTQTLTFSPTTSGTCNLLVDQISIQLVSGLPVELTDFQVKSVGKTVKLSWETASEFRNDFFTLERSKDGKEWTPFFVVKGAGNTEQVSNYTLEDVSPHGGISYYRLSQTDFDGTTELLGVRSIEQETAGKTVSVFPNPATEKLTVEQAEASAIRLFDVTGKEITDRVELMQENEAVTIQISDLTAGIYWVQTPAGMTRFIKE